MMRSACTLILTVTAVILGGCERSPAPAARTGEPGAAPTNRIDINDSVRQNLGITFAKVEYRAVERTLRIPGRFELLPSARRQYRAAVAATVEVAVEQYQRVEPGTVLYSLDSPRWREIQRELADAEAAVSLAQAAIESIAPYREAHERHHAEIQRAVELWKQRVASLEVLRESGGARSDDVIQARAALSNAETAFAETLEKEVDLNAREREALAQFAAAQARQRFLIDAASTLAGISAAELSATEAAVPLWQRLVRIEVRSLAGGVVDEVLATSGSVVEAGSPVLTTVQPEKVRFRAHALQSDLGRLADGLPAAVVAPQGGSLASAAEVGGTITLAPTADADRRMIEVLMAPDQSRPLAAWAKPGVAAFLEIMLSGKSQPETAIPLACVARDGTQSIIFRRDPANPDKAIRMEADLGVDDGRWVVIRSGVAEGNEIVLDGVYQLMVATSGSVTKGGHFHPDGTFHEGDD